MRFYQYEATDNRGQLVQGAIQGSDEGAVRAGLASKGLQVQRVNEMGLPGTPTIARPIPPVAQSPYAYSSPKPPLPGVSPSVPTAIHHTAKGSDKERFFLFSQLSSAFRAGLNAAQAFHEVGQRSAGIFRPSLDEAAAETTRGVAMSDVFARYPDLYPEHVVGVIRAGEMAGFLPDALDEVARQAETAHSFGRWFFWFWFVAINFLLSVPGMWIAMTAIKSTWDLQWGTNGQPGNGNLTPSQGGAMFFGEMWHAFLWPWGPITIGAYAGLYFFRRYYTSRVAKQARHELGLKIPVYGKRARHENLARFSWTLARVSKAGISPARAWQLAADAVPNLAFRDQLMAVGTGLSGSERMSDLVFKSKMFPDEYAPMVATGEYTGDISTAMQRLSDMSAGEFVAAQNYAKVRSGCWGMLLLFITSAILAGMFLYTVDVAIPSTIYKDMDNQ